MQGCRAGRLLGYSVQQRARPRTTLSTGLQASPAQPSPAQPTGLVVIVLLLL